MRRLLSVLVGVCMVAACAGQVFPTGTFVHKTNAAWALEFNSDRTWAFYLGDMEVPEVEGTYSVDGDLYTEESVNDPGCPFTATYRWTYEDNELGFELVGEDECEPRRGTYDGQTFVRSS